MTCIFVAMKGMVSINSNITTRVSKTKKLAALEPIEPIIAAQQLYLEVPNSVFRLQLNDVSMALISRIAAISYELGTICYGSVGVVPHSEKQNRPKEDFIFDAPINEKCKRYVEGKDADRYEINWNNRWLEYDYNVVRRPSLPELLESPKIVLKIVAGKTGLNAAFDLSGLYTDHSFVLFTQKYRLTNVKTRKLIFAPSEVQLSKQYNLFFILSLMNSRVHAWFFDVYLASDLNIGPDDARKLPIPRIDFTTPQAERERLAAQIIGAYSTGDNAGVLSWVQEALSANQTDVVHDVLAQMAQRMIDLNKQKQAEVKRFLAWLEGVLSPSSQTLLPQGEKGLLPRGGKSSKDSDASSPLPDVGEGPGVRGLIDTFAGKTIIQGYLGDYQKGEGETSWEDFLYRLHQNKRRFAVALDDVAGEIQQAYEESLATLLPIKRDLARTDALIDKIVYRLYGLTDAEIELIERPGYEQALADAKAGVVGDEKIDDEQKLEKIAGGILSASSRYFDRVETPTDEETLDKDLPNWRTLPPDAPKFLLTGDYALRTFPEHMDFSSSVIPYTKAVEVVLHQQIFEPFRASHSDGDCRNSFLQAFMRGEKSLTLGSYMIILSSSKEAALRRFIGRSLADVEALVTILSDEAMRDIRNKAAHDEVLTRDEARQARAWALGILGMV